MRVLGAFLIKFSHTLMVMLMVQGEDSIIILDAIIRMCHLFREMQLPIGTLGESEA